MISQQEIALLLGTSRSQWSMYVLGQRHLSSENTLKWKELLSNFHEKDHVMPDENALERWQKKERPQVIAKQLSKNKFNQLKIRRELNQLEYKFLAAQNTMQWISHLRTQKNSINLNEAVLDTIKTKVNKVMNVNGLHHQEICKIKLAVLEYEQTFLESQLEIQDGSY